jgi:uncharacterized repeat protein (TIGR02543 family)
VTGLVQSAADSGTAIVSATAARFGYKFGGWYLDSAFTEHAVFPLAVTSDLVLYARWKRAVFSANVSAAPNLAKRSAGGEVGFFGDGGSAVSGELTVYDAVGNVIRKIKIADAGAENFQPLHDSAARRKVAAWDLRDAGGRLAAPGTYLVRGFVRTAGGEREKVSLKVGVR